MWWNYNREDLSHRFLCFSIKVPLTRRTKLGPCGTLGDGSSCFSGVSTPELKLYTLHRNPARPTVDKF